MNYKALKNHWIEVKGEMEFDAGINGAILIPPDKSKIYLHWLNEKGKMYASYTLTYSTLVQNKLKIVSQELARIHVIEL